MKEVAVQTSATDDADLTKNLILPKTDIAIKNKPSLTSLETNNEKDDKPVENNVVIQQRKTENPVVIIQPDIKKTDLSNNSTIETKKPTIEPNKPFIDPNRSGERNNQLLHKRK